MMDAWPAVSQLPESLVPEIAEVMELLQRGFEQFDHSALDAAIIRHDAHGLMMHLPSTAKPEMAGEQSTYRLFTHALETTFRQRLVVKDYAAQLGYSKSTPTRACLAGQSR